MPLSQQNNVEFFLESQSQGTKYIPEPVNWATGQGVIYERDDESKGFIEKTANDLKFHSDGYDFLQTQIDTWGLREEVILIRRVKDENRMDERWEVRSRLALDLTSLEFDDSNRTATCQGKQGGMFDLLKNNWQDAYDLKKLDDINGNTIRAIDRKKVTLDGRAILRLSKLEVENGREILAIVSGNPFPDEWNARSIPFQVTQQSDEEDITNVYGDKLRAANNNYADLTSLESNNCFITNCDQTTEYTLNGYVEIEITVANNGQLWLDIVRYSGGSDQTFTEKINLDTGDPGIVGEKLMYTFNNYKLHANEGDSFAIGVLSQSTDGIRYTVNNTYLEIREDSFYAPSDCEAITEKEACRQLTAIITGEEDAVVSTLLDNSERLLTNGFWIRQFPDIVNEGTVEERRFQLVTSLKDFLEHLGTMEPIAWWCEWQGDKEVLRIESLSYTQQNFIGIRYGMVDQGKFQYIKASDISRNIIDKNFYSKIVIGSKKGGADYEEVYGLQSVCGRAEWSTVNNRNFAEYRKTSPYRLGDIDVELPRRKLFKDYAEQDTRFDDDILVLDCKLLGDQYYLKKWDDLFDSLPENIYKPESAYNMALTPRQLFEKHSYVLATGLYHQAGQITFSSSNCNSSFKYVRNAVTNDEAQPILHSDLDRPKVKPIMWNFKIPVTQDLEDQIAGWSQNDIQNKFGIVAVDAGEKGIVYLRLVAADTTDNGEHKLIEAYI